jgi:hypothetical protein
MLTRNRPLVRQLEREVDLVEVHRRLARIVREQELRDRLGVGVGEHLVAELDQIAVEPVQRQVADLEMDVGGALLQAEAQEAVQLLPIHSFRALPEACGSRMVIGGSRVALTRNLMCVSSRAGPALVVTPRTSGSDCRVPPLDFAGVAIRASCSAGSGGEQLL